MTEQKIAAEREAQTAKLIMDELEDLTKASIQSALDMKELVIFADVQVEQLKLKLQKVTHTASLHSEVRLQYGVLSVHTRYPYIS